MPDIGTMHQLNPEPPHIGTMHQLGPEPLHTGEIITPQAQAEEYAREAQESADNAALSAAAAQSAAETAQQAAESIAPALDEKAAAIHTAAGPAPIVSIPDAAAAPVDALTVGIEPVQDLHGYDSPWPAGGGVNLLDLSSATGNTVYGFTVTKNDNTGVVTIAGAYSGTTVNASFAFLLNVPYIADTKVIAFDMNASLQEHILYQSAPIRWGNTTNGNLAIDLKGLEQGATYNFTLKPLVCSNSVTPTAWTPYSNICPITGWTGAKVYHSGDDTSNPTELDITFPTEAGTVYGGTLDVITGELVVDRVIDIITGDSSWYGFNTGTGNSSAVVQLTNYQNVVYVEGSSSRNGAISSTGREAPNYWVNARQNEIPNDGDMCFAYSQSGQFRVHRTDVSTITDLSAFKTNFPSTQIVYKLATPITYTLTPQEIRTLLGANNIWADTGDVTVGYKADTKLYIDKKFAELQALILEQ